MRIKTKLILWLCLFWALSVSLQAQYVVTSSGGYGETSGAIVTWSLGEPVTETLTGTSAILTQGFNQGDLIITMIKSPELPGLILKAYPNPANQYLKLSFSDSNLDNLNYILIDMRGKIISQNTIRGSDYEVPFMNLTPSTYILKIYQKRSEIAIFKIIKK